MKDRGKSVKPTKEKKDKKKLTGKEKDALLLQMLGGLWVHRNKAQLGDDC